MDKDKYYIPTIDEFCVGFEYEFKPRYKDGLISFINSKFRYVDYWRKQTIGKERETLEQLLMQYGEPYSIDDVLSYHKDNAIRVKYLDKKDIESLGWELDQCTNKDGCDYYIGSMMDINNWHLAIGGRYRKKYEVNIYDVNKESNLECNIIIKNKHELKVLMKQLGI